MQFLQELNNNFMKILECKKSTMEQETDIVHSIHGTPNSTGMVDLLNGSIVHSTWRMNDVVYLNKMMDQT